MLINRFERNCQFIYYCVMRDELKNLFSNQIILEDGSQFFYTVKPFEMMNILGAVVAVLDEYLFTKKGSSESYKFYRTKDGNWYDVNDDNAPAEYSILRTLKLAIDIREKNADNLTF
jgi:hypothetical protein